MYKIIELEIDPTISGDTGVFEVAWVEYPAIEQELIYFGEQKFYRATEEVSSKACRAIKENEKRGNPAGTQVGKVRAQQLCNKDEISLETVKRMKSYLERAATYYTGDYDDNGTISYDLWGGKPGLSWVNNILESIEMGTQDFVYPTPLEDKDTFISRCVSYVMDEGRSVDEALGKCYGMWENREFAEIGERGGVKESDKAPKSDTPNPDPKGEGTAKGDASSTRGAEVTERVEKILQEKSDDFNERYKDKLGYGVNTGMLKSVYQRGVGAFNTSHSPKVQSPEQWALARVNAFLYLVKNGRPENSKYTGDFDLLPSGHPKKEKMSQDFGPDKVSFDWDDTLDTRRGKRLLEQELSRGSIIYIISARNLTTQEMIDLSLEYGFPGSHIYTTGSNPEKIKKIKELGIKRHYDNNYRVIEELGPVGIKFDYDVTGLPVYDNYPPSGETDSMLVEPTLYEGCGCGQSFEEYTFPGQVGIVDGHPVFETIEDAENHSIYIGCVGHHTHTTVEGNQVYMACDKHPEMNLMEYTTEDFEMKKHFDFLKQTVSPEEFESITSPLLRGFTESEIYAKNHPTPTNYFQYKRKLTGSPDRDFCMSIENRWFRRAQIDLLRDTNLEFGHERQPYSKWLYKGGPECVHAWYGAMFQGKNRADKGYAEGKAGQAPQELPNRGYYSAETRRKSQVAYIISQQNMNSVSYMKDIECAFGDVCKPKWDTQEQMFASKEEERMIYTPLMIPDILIPRLDEVSKEKYYVKFTPGTIKNIRDKFMAELRNRKTNYEHTEKKFEDIVMVETWIVQGEKDKAYELGFTQEQVPVGTWMGAYKVLDTPEGNIVWDKYIKPGKVKGASVEGNFILNFSQVKGDEYLLEQVINIIKQITD